STVISQDTIVALLPEIVLGEVSATSANLPETAATSFQLSWQGIYLLGLFTSMAIFGAKLIQCLRLFKFRKGKEHIIIIPNSEEAFSFLHFIFMGDGLDALSRKQILAHEQVHVEQRHTWDLLIFELLRIVFWFNPFVYIYQRNLAIVHEYIADAKAAGAVTKQQYYQDLLNMTFGTQQLSFTNTFFNHSFIKNRILMLQKSKSKTSAQFKYLLIIPIVLSMMVYVACSSDTAAFLAENMTFEEKVAALVTNYDDKEVLTKEEFNAFSKKLGTLVDEEGHTNPNNPEIFTKALNSMLGKLETVPGGTTTLQEVEYVQDGDIPYAVIDQVPLFPGCDPLASREEQKKCTSQGISKYVNQNFNVKKFKDNGLVGNNRIFVQFKIDKTGNVEDVRSRAPMPALKEEAERVIRSIPQMTPGSQKGMPVAVLYSLPITFNINE
ncbi:MAG: M56 family metallopeptidase, partial [Dokdonia sp.]|nr:M56 family metallopeptidase [Dokdonia sp.]